ncbi:TIGR01906 family membrane protein, partial [Streptococcus mutans]|nr:TIGR01906 family membrane protein [Streptococcus mutans]
MKDKFHFIFSLLFLLAFSVLATI